MVYKRKGKQNAREKYYTWVTLPRFGRVGPFSTGTTDRRRAERMEQLLHDLAHEKPELIEALLAKRFRLPDLWVAKVKGELDQLAQLATDPPLAEAVETTRPHVKDLRARQGLDTLLELAPKGVRLSWLARPKHITEVMGRDLERGTRPNSVARSLVRGIVEVLTFHYGRKFRLEVFSEVTVPSEDDTRRVDVSPEQIQRLLAEADVEMRDLVLLAILTAIDRGPLLRIQAQHFDEQRQSLRVFDTKAKSRQRTLVLSDLAAQVLRRAAAGKAPSERVFPLTAPQVTDRWNRIRRRAGVPELRFKDLRHLLPTLWMGLGYSVKDLMRIMGHTQISTSAKYISELPAGDQQRLNEVAAALGLAREHLRVEEGGR